MNIVNIAPTTNVNVNGKADAESHSDKSVDDDGFSRIYDTFRDQTEKGDKASVHSNAHQETDDTSDQVSTFSGNKRTGNLRNPDAFSDENFPSANTETVSSPEDFQDILDNTPKEESDISRLLTNLLSTDKPAIVNAGHEKATQERSGASSHSQNLWNIPVIKAESEDLGGQKRASVTVLSRETHFAPIELPSQADKAGTKTGNVPDSSLPKLMETNDAVSDDGRLQDKQQVMVSSANATGTSGGSKRTDLLREPLSPSLNENRSRALNMDMSNPKPDILGSVSGTFAHTVDQIISQVRELASTINQAAKTADPSLLTGGVENSGGPMRILRLQLQPEELGLVTARLRIIGGVLEVRLTADKQQSVEILRRDQEKLIETLQRTGYKAEIASIDFSRPQTIAQPATSQQPAHAGGQGDSHENGNSPANSSGNNTSQHQEAADRQSEKHKPEQRDETVAARTPHDPDAVYL